MSQPPVRNPSGSASQAAAPILAVAAAPADAPAPPIFAVAAAPVPNATLERWRNLYPAFDARLNFCLGEVDLTLSLLQGVLTEQEVIEELAYRFPLPAPQPLVPAFQAGAGAIVGQDDACTS